MTIAPDFDIFDMALRGYAVDEVDALVERAEAALATRDTVLRLSARDALRAANLNTSLRGYHRGQVVLFLEALARELEEPATS
jgi:DivIVA domain-containing protein